MTLPVARGEGASRTASELGAVVQVGELTPVLANDQVTLQMLLASAHGRVYRADILRWAARLSAASRVLQAWASAQSLWEGMAPLFRADDGADGEAEAAEEGESAGGPDVDAEEGTAVDSRIPASLLPP